MTSDSMRISGIHLSNVRAIRKLQLPPNSGDQLPDQVLFVGANSTCKTTLLRCLCLGLCSDFQATALVAEVSGSFVRDGASKAVIELTLHSRKHPKEKVTLTVSVLPEGGQHRPPREAGEDRVQVEVEPQSFDRRSIFVCGYGAGRATLATESSERYRTMDAVYTLFRYDQPLQSPELILRRLQKHYSSIYDVTLSRIRRVLGLSAKHRFELAKSGIKVHGPRFGSSIPFEAIADGYKATFSWLCDLVGWAMVADKIDKETGDIEGIVLVDEIEQHIHPSWQASLLKFLKNVFPNLQVIATTHSPLVALGARREGLTALRRRGGTVSAVEDVPDFSGYSVEDLLVSAAVFDTSAYGPEMSQKLTQYSRLLRIPQAGRTEAQRRKLRDLAKELLSRELPGIEESPLRREITRLRSDLGL